MKSVYYFAFFSVKYNLIQVRDLVCLALFYILGPNSTLQLVGTQQVLAECWSALFNVPEGGRQVCGSVERHAAFLIPAGWTLLLDSYRQLQAGLRDNGCWVTTIMDGHRKVA